MLHNKFNDGGSGIDRIDESIKIVEKWRKNNPENILHF